LAYYWLIGSNSKHVAGQRPEPSLNVVGTLNCPRIFIGIPGGKMSSQQASRSRRAQDIHSPIEEAHISTTLVHLANASYRLGRTLQFDSAQEQVIGDEEANRLLRGSYRAAYIVSEKI